MSLQGFFDAVHPFLTGEGSLEEFLAVAGPSSSPEADLRFYRWLVAFDQERILSELCPALRALVDRTEGLQWGTLVAAYVAAWPPGGYSVPGVGEHLADWLVARRAEHPEQPVALECLADLAWTRFLARTAPDEPGLGMDQRVFLRHYPVDVIGLEAKLVPAQEGPVEPGSPCTLLIYRHRWRLGVTHLVPSLATLGLLAELQGLERRGPLAELPREVLDAERARLIERGVIGGSTQAS
ncbi:MAG TPA: hypothetical protein ENK18_17910 [Deltaproteobacteria bacterium]|nr:hypothetical protein [Deltaproteobacteria bacterium]